MSIILNDNIEVRAPKAIDSRTSLSTIAQRDAIPLYYRYNGMPVWVDETSSNYRWYNDTWNLEDYNTQNNYKIRDSLFDVFLPNIIKNQEINNNGISGTEWSVVSINTITKEIVVNNTLPYFEGFNNRSNNYDYWGAFVSYFEAVRIVSVNYSTKTITYDSIYGTISVGDKLKFFNPFRSGIPISESPLLDIDSIWANRYVTPGGVWRHSSGEYYMFVNGNHSAVMRVGMAKSTDLVNWSYFGSNPRYISGTSPFNKSWMGIGMYASGNPLKIKDSQYYYQLFVIKNTSSLWETIVCVIDEDGEIIHMPDNPISIPSVANTHGNQAGDITYFDGVYKVFLVNRKDAAGYNNWTIYELDMPTPETLKVSSSSPVIHGSGTTSWYGSHTDDCKAIIYNGKLYLLVAATGLATEDTELWRSNREHGLLLKENGSWVNYTSNPILCNPILSQYIWTNSMMWASDHTGSQVSIIEKDGYFYVYFAMNRSSDTYKIGGYKFNIMDI